MPHLNYAADIINSMAVACLGPNHSLPDSQGDHFTITISDKAKTLLKNSGKDLETVETSVEIP